MYDHHTGEDTREIRLPEQLASDVEERLATAPADSVDAYVVLALELLLSQLDRQEIGPTGGADDTADANVTDDLRDRLESLGYL